MHYKIMGSTICWTPILDYGLWILDSGPSDWCPHVHLSLWCKATSVSVWDRKRSFHWGFCTTNGKYSTANIQRSSRILGKKTGSASWHNSSLIPRLPQFSIEKLREPGDEANIIAVLPIFLHKYHYSVLFIGKVHYQGCLLLSGNRSFH